MVCNLSFLSDKSILILEEVLNILVRNHLLVEDVGTRLGALHHLNHLCLFNLLVKSHLLQDGVILHQLHALRRVLTVLHRNIAAGAGQTTVLHLGALQDHLDAITF